jgi:hypothetical protein
MQQASESARTEKDLDLGGDLGQLGGVLAAPCLARSEESFCQVY